MSSGLLGLLSLLNTHTRKNPSDQTVIAQLKKVFCSSSTKNLPPPSVPNENFPPEEKKERSF